MDDVIDFLSRNDWRPWPCGHQRTAENTQSVGAAGFRCRDCRRAISTKHNQGNRKVRHA